MLRLLFILILVPLLCTAQDAPKRWFKGNLHTHSYWSDGDEFPEMIMDWYKSHGYQFVALSDHNILAEGEKWKLITKSKTFLDGFNKYVRRYGDGWVQFKKDTGRISVRLKTLDEYRPLFEDKNFLIIKAEELTDRFESKQVHMGVINVQSVIKPQGGSGLQEVMQRNLDAVIAQRRATGVPILQHLNHPNFYYSITAQNIIDLNGERFFEVYNGHSLVHNLGDSLHPGTEEIWDRVNVAYIKANKPLLYGIGTDDSHHYHLFGPAHSNAGRGWVMVNATELTPASLIAAMEAGEFYASTGVSLKSISFSDGLLTVEVDAERGINYKIEFIGVRKDETKSDVVNTVKGASGQFRVTADYLFVRARVISDKKRTNPVEEVEYGMAWVQPVRPK
jgi:hypothetical protein